MRKYTQLIINIIIAIMTIFQFFACGKHKEATIQVCSEYVNTMENIYSKNNKAKIEPTYKTFVVRKGDSIYNNSITIENLTDSSITISLHLKFVGYTYDKNGMLLKHLGVNNVFTFNKGERLFLDEYQLLDASHSINIILNP